MNRNTNERFIILLVSIACFGLTLKSILFGWEFWVPPLIIIGTVLLWIMHISQNPEYNIRRVCYFAYALLTAFYYGVHSSIFFDLSAMFVLIMAAFSFLNEVYMINLFLIEYVAVIVIQFMMRINQGNLDFFSDSIVRIIFHLFTVGLMYFCCVKAINDRIELIESEAEKEHKIESVDRDMEDFLSNISHELRTPVNVVNGMSEMLIKKQAGTEAFSIKNAGVRLAYQIEDIQDYTECKGYKIILEEDEYMSTSLIHDVVAGFRLLDNKEDLELIVDLDPKVPSKMKGDVKKLNKIFRHLLENAVKFTKQGGIYIKMSSEETDYGVNLCIEMTDTGIGMDRRAVASVSEGMFQVNKRRNRSTGGIGLGLFIVYGFAHRMGGFVKIESEKNSGTMVRVTIPQKVVDKTPCLSLDGNYSGDILFHVKSDKYITPRVRDFYRLMATNLAKGVHVPLYSAQSTSEIDNLMDRLDVATIFMGQEEYEENPEYFDELSKGDVVVVVSAEMGFKANPGSNVMVMPKPLYAYPVIRVLNDGRYAGDLSEHESNVRPVFRGVKAMVVDDEPMNLVVAAGLFRDYEMIIDTASSGKEAINKFREEYYDVIFMDHMMPEMDGVEAMKLIKSQAAEMGRNIVVIALTANAVSGAREMFMAEGFDGFIAKPINTMDFERVMRRELPGSITEMGGQR